MALFNLPSINPGINFRMPGGNLLSPYLQTPGTGFNGLANLLRGPQGPAKYEPLRPDQRYSMPPIQLPPLPKPQPFVPSTGVGKPLPGNQFSWQMPPVTVGGAQITRATQLPQAQPPAGNPLSLPGPQITQPVTRPTPNQLSLPGPQITQPVERPTPNQLSLPGPVAPTPQPQRFNPSDLSLPGPWSWGT
jgi:hypothetical protein